MWIGLLYGILCVAVQHEFYNFEEEGTIFPYQSKAEAVSLIAIYREKTVQCMVIGKYTKSVPYSIETLLTYLCIESFRTPDSQVENWVLLGIVIRIALRMGYHRDASNFPRITPFQAEMRRRVWAMIFEFDLILSTQFGLPRMIQDSQSDTAEPRNLLDEEIDLNMKELPPPRTDSSSLMAYLAIKNRVFAVYGQVSDILSAPRPCSYTEILKLDQLVNNTYNACPAALIMRPNSLISLEDDGNMVLRRFFLVLLYHKSRCVLHRKYLIPGRNDNRFAYSRITCIDAAVDILKYQKLLASEIIVGGRLYKKRQKVLVIAKQDFLLATTVLCYAVDHELKLLSTGRIIADISGAKSKITIIEALKSSYQIWLQTSEVSQEAGKAATAIRTLLKRAELADSNPNLFKVPSNIDTSKITQSLYSVDATDPSATTFANAFSPLQRIDAIQSDSLISDDSVALPNDFFQSVSIPNSAMISPD
jgi:hypothetical protein